MNKQEIEQIARNCTEHKIQSLGGNVPDRKKRGLFGECVAMLETLTQIYSVIPLENNHYMVDKKKVAEAISDIEASAGFVEIPQLNEKIKVVAMDTLNRIAIDYFGLPMFNQNESKQ